MSSKKRTVASVGRTAARERALKRRAVAKQSPPEAAAATKSPPKRAATRWPPRRLWGGRFRATPDARLRRFNDSFAFDRQLLDEDIEGSIAWAEALAAAGVLDTSECRAVVEALQEVRREAGRDATLARGDHEDVHSFVEAALARRIGELAGKLHTGRSRNDQVATDLKLWLKKALRSARAGVLNLARALTGRAGAEAATAMPGYTHLKRAEPVTFGHWCLAYVEMLLRDADRFQDALDRGDECPLGSGALAGTPLAIDRTALAHRLGFERPTANSLDAVSDRDMAAEYLFASGLLLVHLSRLAEDLVFFSSDEAGFIELPDALATGSSRLPHKKNPDVLELVRAHAGRAIGELAGLLAVLKGLPLAYDKDLQLDKEPVFRMQETLALALPALAALVQDMQIDRAGLREAAGSDLVLATELADALARRGVPFRSAHELVGRRVVEAVAAGRSLRELGPTAEITSADLDALDIELALRRKDSLGGTAPRQVARAALLMLARIGDLRRAGSGASSKAATSPGAGSSRQIGTERSTGASRQARSKRGALTTTTDRSRIRSER